MPITCSTLESRSRDRGLFADERRHVTMSNRELDVTCQSQEHQNPTVLVVEDEPLIRMMIAGRLREAGCGVIEATGADEAIAVLRSGADVQVVLSDIRMPGSLDGIGLAKFVKSERPELKVVLASGHLPALNATEHDGFFAKPYDAERVIAHIRTLV